jgi:hypothetical protein
MELQINPVLISCIRMSWDVQVPFLSEMPAAKESQLTGVMWYKDTPGHQDKRTTENKGFTSRKVLTAQSKSVQMMGKLHIDLFFQEKYLLNHVRSAIQCSIGVIHDLCFYKRVSISQVDVVVPHPTDGKFVRSLILIL